MASPQLVSWSSGIVGGSSPVAARHGADSPRCATSAASSAEAVALILPAHVPTAPPCSPVPTILAYRLLFHPQGCSNTQSTTRGTYGAPSALVLTGSV